MYPTLIRRLAESSLPSKLRNATSPPSTGVYSSRFKPKKVWPPDFSKLSEKEQFRFERRYKRRIKLATARPRWDKFVRLAQFVSVTSILVYTVLFMDWNTEKTPFQGIREKFWDAVHTLASSGQRHERPSPEISPVADRK
ncbi:hypothetical protein F4779DRAFT_199920 [Xylariaceae sp. FL0662B]|nr:hypothetical protein F4779DRAFT_199920 [Xylariaceae sp. FL0662B]